MRAMALLMQETLGMAFDDLFSTRQALRKA